MQDTIILPNLFLVSVTLSSTRGLILGHVPPPYSPYFKQLCGQYERYQHDKLLRKNNPAISHPTTLPKTVNIHISLLPQRLLPLLSHGHAS